jgi:Rieske Fe-S protein
MNTRLPADNEAWRPGRRELLEHFARLGAGAISLGLLSGCPDERVLRSTAQAQAPDESREIESPAEVKLGVDRISPGYAVEFRAGKYRGYLHRSAGDNWIALSSRCTHAGCIVSFQRDIQGYKCPCHGSAYDFEGKPLKGPAKRPLLRFQTRVEGDAVFVVFQKYVAPVAEAAPVPPVEDSGPPPGVTPFSAAESGASQSPR